MKVLVTGASGNIGTRVTTALKAAPEVDEIVGLSRRRPDPVPDDLTWVSADLGTDDLTDAVRGADVVVHLAWLLQPSHDDDALWRANVVGTRRLLHACAAAGVGAVVHASSLAAYGPGPKERVDESWPTEALHSADCADAFRRAVVDGAAAGPFNVAAEPVLDGAALGRLLDARPVTVPDGLLRGAADLTWRLRRQPTDPGWIDRERTPQGQRGGHRDRRAGRALTPGTDEAPMPAR